MTSLVEEARSDIMKKSRRPKPKPKQAQNPLARLPQRQPPPPTPPPQPAKTISLKRLWIFLWLAAGVPGSIATAFFFYDLYYQAAFPQIEIASVETDSPFGLPFSVSTESIRHHDT